LPLEVGTVPVALDLIAGLDTNRPLAVAVVQPNVRRRGIAEPAAARLELRRRSRTPARLWIGARRDSGGQQHAAEEYKTGPESFITHVFLRVHELCLHEQARIPSRTPKRWDVI